MPKYDYIIIGAGASGLLLADALGSDDFFSSKSILLLEKSHKHENDRTWCFWEKGEGPFEAILYNAWPKIRFAGNEFSLSQNIAPYTYKMIRGIDFYKRFIERITSYKNLTFLNEGVTSVIEQASYITVATDAGSYLANQVFDSRFDYKKLLDQKIYPVLQQHFLGWFVKTEKAVFNVDEATFMDFSVPQKGNTRFMYVLPFSKTEALVEYTLFSEYELKKSDYEEAIKNYLKNLGVENYEIKETERGNIPMSCYDFTTENSARYLKIGIAGGWAKPSTGFTFYNTFKKVEVLIAYLKNEKDLSNFHKRNRFSFYDVLLLDILNSDNQLGAKIFGAMFKKRSPQLILKFLDEETSFWEDLLIIWACPKLPFIKALVKRLF